MSTVELASDRLLLRRWRPQDREPFAAINADPEVMRFFPATLTRAESDALIERFERGHEQDGWGLWALELRATGRLVGFTGLAPAGWDPHYLPDVEIGWRLARDAWGRGYATEAAWAVLAFAFERAGLDGVVSLTAVANERSRAVMHRLGMRRDSDEDYEHPLLPEGHPLRPHVVYRLSRADWARDAT
jgi:ribosomal-protein-alanine N-acetyltransferase